MEDALIEAYGDCESSSEDENPEQDNVQIRESSPSCPPDVKMLTDNISSVCDQKGAYSSGSMETDNVSKSPGNSTRKGCNPTSEVAKKRLLEPTNIISKLEAVHMKRQRLQSFQPRASELDGRESADVKDNHGVVCVDEMKQSKMKKMRRVPANIFIPPQVLSRKPNISTEDLVAFGIKK